MVSSAEHVYLATDPDREGEIISWHLKEELEIPEEKYDRVVFREITKDVVLKSIEEHSKIDMDLVKGAETRRILDRIIGFRLSKLMQYKTGGKSAGRVQSVALKLIVDREREILAFIPKEYWTIEADFKDFTAELFKYKNKDIEINTELEADEIINNLSKSFNIERIGYAILTWSPAGLLFAVWTFANLGPRAKSLTEKYEKEFGEEYTKLNKRHIIPFIW